MKKLNNKKGISLIVLVITIIVMIILAAAIILSLQSSGIIGRTNEAKIKSDDANMLQAANVAYSEYVLEKNLGGIENTPEQYVKDKLEDNFSQDELKKLNVLSDGTIQILPTIPTGFTVSIYEGEQKISEGLVVYETNSLSNIDQETAQKTYNQYVWIPVKDITKFVRRDGYSNGVLQTLVSTENATEPFNKQTEDGITLSKTNDLTGEYAEYEKIKESVKKYGGFYIARYEAGLPEGKTSLTVTTTDIPVIKKDVAVWNNVSWGAGMTSIGTSGAVHISRRIYPENRSGNAVSTLVYGVQWDVVMSFMEEVKNLNLSGGKTYIEDSTGMGVYGVNEPVNTGSNNAYKVKNIYDMAGNAWEWTMEGGANLFRVVRGGGCNFYNMSYSGTVYPASTRDALDLPSTASIVYGFRPALYLK